MRTSVAGRLGAQLALAVAFVYSSSAGGQERERLPIEQLRLFTEVYGLVRQSYVATVEHDVLIRNAIDGLLKVDPLAAYIDPEEFKDLQAGQRPVFGSVGLEMTSRAGVLRLVSIIDGSPASRAGLQPHDALLKIDEVDVREMRLQEAFKLLRGKVGSPIRLTVQRRDESAPREVNLVREIIRVQSVRSRLVTPEVAYVRVAQFQDATPDILAKQIADLFARAQPKFLVLDVRSSPGGLLQSCVASAALFLPDNALVVKVAGRTDDSKREYRANPQDYLRRGQADPRSSLPPQVRTMPMAVLVDRGTASGSEFVAAALRDHQRAFLVGDHTFGRGVIQTIFPLGVGAVRLTTAHFQSARGEQFEGKGLRPDIEVSDFVEAANFGSENDPVLRAAIDRLKR